MDKVSWWVSHAEKSGVKWARSCGPDELSHSANRQLIRIEAHPPGWLHPPSMEAYLGVFLALECGAGP